MNDKLREARQKLEWYLGEIVDLHPNDYRRELDAVIEAAADAPPSTDSGEVVNKSVVDTNEPTEEMEEAGFQVWLERSREYPAPSDLAELMAKEEGVVAEMDKVNKASVTEADLDRWYERLEDALEPSDAAPVACSLWERALDLIEWANDLRTGSRSDVGKWGEERRAFHAAILAHPEDAPGGPKVVCLCGSTRFWREFQRAGLRETMAGRIVLSIGAASGTDDEHFGNLDQYEYDRIKTELDELHLRKIDLADEILVLNVDGYIGESTARELEYAKQHGKAVRFLEPVNRLKGDHRLPGDGT